MQVTLIFRVLHCLAVLDAIESFQVTGLDYVISTNTKCRYSVMENVTSSSAIRCAAECQKRRGCSRVNFKKPQCEILSSDPAFNDSIIEEQGWKCIRKYLAKHIL